MAVVVIAGGIDLSIAAMMAVASVTAAVLMDGADATGRRCWSCCAVLALGLAMGAINGALIVVTRVPDIVVTLAMLFVWQGVALLILNAPGGGGGPLAAGADRGRRHAARHACAAYASGCRKAWCSCWSWSRWSGCRSAAPSWA